MTAGSLAGLFGLNLLFLVSGSGLLWGLRGWEAWSELVRLVGVAYLLGVAAVGMIVVELLVAGVTLSAAAVVGVGAAVLAAGLAAGRLLGRRLPRLTLGRGGHEPYLGLAVVAAVAGVVTLEALFRVARLQPIVAYDVWAFWGQKAKAIHYFGGLDEQLFTSLPGATYPVLVPALEAAVFEFIGDADVTTVHVQFWCLLAGFVFAIAGLLRPAIPLVLVWPFLALFLVMPELHRRALNPQADWTLDFFFAAGALCVALWLLRDDDWLLIAAALFLGAAMSAKREGQLLAACLLTAAVVVSAPRARRAWPRLAAVGAGAFSLTLPWQIWYRSHDLGAERPLSPLQLLDHADRAWPSFRVVADVLFDYDLWLLAAPIGLAVAMVALLAGERVISLLYVLTAALAVVGFTWILWSHLTLPIDASDRTPIPRAVGAVVTLSIAFAPLLLSQALERRKRR